MTTSLSNPAESEDGISAEEFRAAFRNYPAGVAVITADAGDGPVGLTATSVSSVSADPPILVFSLSTSSSSAPAIARANSVVVHLLSADQAPIAKLFATSGIDRFADTAMWNRLDSGEPFLTDAYTWIRGPIINRMDLGGSTVVAVRATHAVIEQDGHSEPLVYHNRSWHRLSHESRIPD